MLVLSRKVNESIKIGDHVVVSVQEIKGGKVRLGIKAPGDIRVLRNELDAGGDVGTESEKPSASPNCEGVSGRLPRRAA
ncbi:MAG: carbon storage regulator [Planctomycetota bacterium]|nr:carbon storage regulator [Planctomycetota bacterium]